MNEPIISTIFPTIVYSAKLNREIDLDEKNFVIENAKNVFQNSFNFRSFDTNVLENNRLNKIKVFVEENLKRYVDDVLKPKHNVSLGITESWLNYTNKNEKHHRHHHANSVVSGVFYFNCLDKDSIVLYNKLQHYSTFEIEAKEYTLLNSMSWNFPVEIGTLILIPSYIEHEVYTNESNTPKTRISLAFNTMLRGQISTLSTKKIIL